MPGFGNSPNKQYELKKKKEQFINEDPLVPFLFFLADIFESNYFRKENGYRLLIECVADGSFFLSLQFLREEMQNSFSYGNHWSVMAELQ